MGKGAIRTQVTPQAPAFAGDSAREAAPSIGSGEMRATRDDSLTIVTGVPRSGTSLVMQMLAAGGLPVASDGVRRADEDNPRGYFELEAARRLPRDASWLAGISGCAVKLVHTLVPSLPPGRHYRVLLVRRRLDEVLASQRVMLTRQGRTPDEREDARLLPVLTEQLAQLERWLTAREDLAWLGIDYAELVAEPGREAARMSAFLGGGLDSAAMAASVDPALHRQRR